MCTPVNTDNLDMLKEIIGDELKEILEVYLQSSPDLINGIAQALESENMDDLRIHSHTLKGSSANIGANQLAEYSAQMEEMAKNQSISGESHKLLTTIQSEIDSVSAFLQTYISQF